MAQIIDKRILNYLEIIINLTIMFNIKYVTSESLEI